MKVRQLAILALVAAGAAAAGSAQARDNVHWSITLASPFGLPLPPIPVPVMTVQRPPVVVVEQQPVYAPGPVYGGYPYGPGPGYDYRPAYRTRYEGPPPPPRGWDRRDWHGGDHDGRFDRRDHGHNPRWDRDGDGVPNRYDRQPDRPNRR